MSCALSGESLSLAGLSLETLARICKISTHLYAHCSLLKDPFRFATTCNTSPSRTLAPSCSASTSPGIFTSLIPGDDSMKPQCEVNFVTFPVNVTLLKDGAIAAGASRRVGAAAAAAAR
eukprot:2881567-Rhodomonas_salina.3